MTEQTERAKKYREQNVYEGAPDEPEGMRHLRELAEKEPNMVQAMARVAAATDNAYRFLRARVNQNGSITLAPAEAKQILKYLTLAG